MRYGSAAVAPIRATARWRGPDDGGAAASMVASRAGPVLGPDWAGKRQRLASWPHCSGRDDGQASVVARGPGSGHRARIGSRSRLQLSARLPDGHASYQAACKGQVRDGRQGLAQPGSCARSATCIRRAAASLLRARACTRHAGPGRTWPGGRRPALRRPRASPCHILSRWLRDHGPGGLPAGFDSTSPIPAGKCRRRAGRMVDAALVRRWPSTRRQATGARSAAGRPDIPRRSGKDGLRMNPQLAARPTWTRPSALLLPAPDTSSTG